MEISYTMHCYINSSEASQWQCLPLYAIYWKHPKQQYSHCAHLPHYDDVIMGAIASQITSLTIVYSTIYSGADQSNHQSSASLAFVWGIHRGPVNSPHKWPVTRKMFPFDDVIMISRTFFVLLSRWTRYDYDLFCLTSSIIQSGDWLYDNDMNYDKSSTNIS